MANEKILIVDDDLDTLKLVGLMLQRQGYRIVVANNGLKALTMAKAEQPELILLDVMMPDMDGFEVARRLRSEPSTANIPILMFTAKSQVEDKLTGFDAGADDYLTKPAHPAELLARVKKLLHGTHTTGNLPKAPAGPAQPRWTVGVLGAKGGVGTTTIALTLGIMLHQESKEDVVIAELRPGQGTMGLELGHPALNGLGSLLAQPAQQITPQAVEEVLVSYLAGVRLLFASFDPAEVARSTNLTALETVARYVRQAGRYSILDLGPSLQPAMPKILPLCDEILVVVDGFPQTVQMAKTLVDYLLMHGIGQGRIAAVLVNRTRADIQMAWMDIQNRLGVPVATVIPPMPETAYRAQQSNKPMVLMQPHGMLAAQMGKVVRAQIEKSR